MICIIFAFEAKRKEKGATSEKKKCLFYHGSKIFHRLSQQILLVSYGRTVVTWIHSAAKEPGKDKEKKL